LRSLHEYFFLCCFFVFGVESFFNGVGVFFDGVGVVLEVDGGDGVFLVVLDEVNPYY